MKINEELINKPKLLTAVQYCMKTKYHSWCLNGNAASQKLN